MPWLNWGVTTTFVLFQFFLQAAAGLMADQWQADFHLTATEVGYLSAAFYFAYMIMQIPVGLAYDRFGARRVLWVASLLLCLGIFGLAMSEVYWQAYTSRFLMGMGSAFGFVGMMYITSTWFSGSHFALLIGVAETLAMMGVALAEIGMAWVISLYGWRMLMYAAGIIMSLVSLFILLCIRDPQHATQKVEKPASSIISAIGKVLAYPEVWLAGLYGFALFAIVNVMVTLWGVPFFTQYSPPISYHTAGSLMSVVFVGIAIGAPFNGWLIGYLGKRQAIMTLFASCTALLFGIILYVPALPLTALFVLLFLTGFFCSSYIHVFAIVKDSIELELRATALATTNMILMASAPLLQPVVGKLLELKYTFPQALSLIVVFLILAVVVSLGLDKNKLTALSNSLPYMSDDHKRKRIKKAKKCLT